LVSCHRTVSRIAANISACTRPDQPAVRRSPRVGG
jgi:hypothetical protein